MDFKWQHVNVLLREGRAGKGKGEEGKGERREKGRRGMEGGESGCPRI